MIMRITLTRISILSNPNVIFIDEGFGSLDRENFFLIASILSKLKCNFDAMIIITHLDELKAYADLSINIARDKSLSFLRFGDVSKQEKRLSCLDEISDSSEKVKTFRQKQKELILDKINNGTINLEQLLITKSEDTFSCCACNKTFRLRANAIQKHLSKREREAT